MLVIQHESQKKVDLYCLGSLNPKSGQVICVYWTLLLLTFFPDMTYVIRKYYSILSLRGSVWIGLADQSKLISSATPGSQSQAYTRQNTANPCYILVVQCWAQNLLWPKMSKLKDFYSMVRRNIFSLPLKVIMLYTGSILSTFLVYLMSDYWHT